MSFSISRRNSARRSRAATRRSGRAGRSAVSVISRSACASTRSRARCRRSTTCRATPVLTGARATAYRLEDAPVPMPTVDGAIGIFRGFPLGLTNVGGLDLLVSASYIPKVDAGRHLDRSGHAAQVRLWRARQPSPGIDCVARRVGDVSQARFASSLIDRHVARLDAST